VVIDAATAANKAVAGEVYVPPIANHVPTVRIKWEKSALNLTADEVRKRMKEGTPSIEITPGQHSRQPRRAQSFSVGIWQLQPGEVDVVAEEAQRIADLVGWC
jgi:L-seryl-tRNA(Ser) seleniumtransferase